MPASNPLHNLPVRASRVAFALAGIFLLLLQMLSPVLASTGESMWVEICSEAGAVWVQVDLEEETEGPIAPCPKCADCALCAITAAAPVPDLPTMTQPAVTHLAVAQCVDQLRHRDATRLWPETRGPPCATQEATERALRASMASTLNTGGAPWS